MTYNEILNTITTTLCQRTKDGSLQWYDVSKVGCLSSFETDDDGNSWFLEKTGSGEYCQLSFNDKLLTRCEGARQVYEAADKQVRLRQMQQELGLLQEALKVATGGDARPPQKEETL